MYKRRERGVHPKNFSSPGVRTVMGGTKRNHARCTERNFPPFSRLNWSLGKVAVFLVIYIFAAYKSTSARPLLLKRGRVKRGSNGRPLNFCINFYAIERIWWPAAVSIAETRYPHDILPPIPPLHRLKYIRFFNFSSINDAADEGKNNKILCYIYIVVYKSNWNNWRVHMQLIYNEDRKVNVYYRRVTSGAINSKFKETLASFYPRNSMATRLSWNIKCMYQMKCRAARILSGWFNGRPL